MENNIVLSPISIGELGNLLLAQIREELKSAAPTYPARAINEIPVLFPRMLEITGLKERSAREKIAAGEIPYYQKDRRLYFFESELIAWVRSGKVKTTAEIEGETKDYLRKKKAIA